MKISNTPEFVTYCCYICGQRCGQIKDVMEVFTNPVRAHFLEDYGQENLWKTPPFVQEVFHDEEEPEINDTNAPTVTGVKVEIPASSIMPINIKQEVVKTEKEVEVVQESTSLPAERPRKVFTPEQVREHITGLRQWVGQSKAKVEKNQALEHSMSENSCQLCAVEKLSFEPPPIYFTPCGARINRNAMFYTVGTGDTRHYFCIPCYSDSRGDTINVDGTNVLES
ncbi:unnamed protein product [Lactuca saligna]|uniref:histone acetyltransferase n=1 Tax=Lactuca saligna TaxID=75948 RepID=A0AA35VPC6_LACSI|nr:unnamed protein product [Lactuca saligna]